MTHFEDQNRGIDKGSPENSSENKNSNLKKKTRFKSPVSSERFKTENCQ